MLSNDAPLTRTSETTHPDPRVGIPTAGPQSVFVGPFGPRRIIYADFTASGRSLPLIEQALERVVLPFYGNTHSEASRTGMETTRIREAARIAVRRAVNAGDQHAVIFCGAGSTAAINKLVRMMGLALPSGQRARDAALAAIPEPQRPLVIVGPFEHHSNELPWRESLATLVRLPLDAEGRPCIQTLSQELARHAERPQRIVALSAASNVTGVLTDLAAAACITHEHCGKLCVDFAAGAPYLPIHMCGTGSGDHIDAAFFSPHKFLGGPGASGVLVADRALCVRDTPTAPGGGTVRFVTRRQHRYLDDLEQREEAGTPAILGDIRAGLVMQLKSDIGLEAIHAAERRAVARARELWQAEPGLELLGPASTDRLAIFSFNVRSGNRMLHHAYVVRLLNDLFGIQARAGCSCAGPYGHDLLDIDEDSSVRYQAQIEAGCELVKPGWVRLGLHYTFDDATVDSILEALRFVARRGKDLLPFYVPDPASGRWDFGGEMPAPVDRWEALCSAWRGGTSALPGELNAPAFDACLREAYRLADVGAMMAGGPPVRLPPEAEALRWFWLPGER